MRTRFFIIFCLCIFLICSSAGFVQNPSRVEASKRLPNKVVFEPAENIPIWNYTYDAFGSEENNRGYSIIETSDGGFVVAGQAQNTTMDFWVMRVDANGTELWNTTIDNGSLERAYDVIEVSSGGFAACGYVRISSWNYYYLVRLNESGDVDWMKNYTGNADTEARALAETDDGGFILVGRDNYGGGMYVVRTDENGTLEWDTTIYHGDNLFGSDVVDLSGSNGYIVAGFTEIENGDTYDFFHLMKLDEDGNHVWNSTHGGPETEYCFGMTQALDGGYVLGGTTSSWGGGGYDMYLVKFDNSGNLQWNQTYGGSGNEMCQSVTVTEDGGYAIAGWAQGTGDDIWLVRTDSEGEMWWSEKIHNDGNDRADCIVEVHDGGYALTGYIDPDGRDWDMCIYRLSEPRWDPSPTGKELEFDEALYYDVNATSTDGPLEWSVNDTESFSLDSDGILRNATILPIDQISIEIKVEDNHGHWIQAEIAIAVAWVFSDLKFDDGQRVSIQGVTESPDGGFVLACNSDPIIWGNVRSWMVKYNISGEQEWNVTYPYAYIVQDIITCSDGGFAAAGLAAEPAETDGEVWILRMNETGHHLWNSTFRRPADDVARSLVETPDGGFILIGDTHEAPGGTFDFWAIRTNSSGSHIWNMTYGYPGFHDRGYSVTSCAAGGYALIGYTEGTGFGNQDAWMVRINEDNTQLWNRSYGGDDVFEGWSIIELSEGGFAFTGSATLSGEVYTDALIIRTNETGHKVWNYTYGGDNNDDGWEIVQLYDGSLAVAGYTYSFSGGNQDGYYLRVDLDGAVMTNESYGNPVDSEYFRCLVEVSKGGVAMGGRHTPFGSISGSAYFVQRPILKWTPTPTNQTSELGDVFSLQLHASSAVRVRYWWIDNQVDFSITQDGKLVNATSWQVDDYTVTIRAFDHIHNMVQATITISVVDTTDPSWVVAPTDQEVDYLEPFSYHLKADDLSSLTDWNVNNTVHFAISGDGLVTNNSVLEIGIYSLGINVSDAYGNILEGEFRITVYDDTNPSTDHPADIQYEVGDTGYSITWTPTDDHPESYEIFRNGTLVASGDWNTTGEDIAIIVDGLAIGTYNYTIVIYDMAGNSANDTVIVQVLPATTPTTTASVSTTPTTTTTTTPPPDNTLTIIMIGGIAAGVVIIVIILKKRS
jgi:hypothetical protein